MIGFHLLLPPGWARVDLTGDGPDDLDRFVSGVSRQANPSRQPAVARVLRENLVPRLQDLAGRGVVCAVTPVTLGLPSSSRPFISFRPFDVEGVDPLHLLQALAADDPTARLVEIPGLVAVRTHATVDATQAAQDAQPSFDRLLADPDVPKLEVDADDLDLPDDLQMVSSRVRYTMGDPDDRDRWIDVQMAVDHPNTTEAQELAEGVIELFDAVMSTFTWEDV